MKNDFADSFMGMLTGDYSKLAQESLKKEVTENTSKFLVLGLVDKLVELKIISELDITKMKLKGEYHHLNILKESLNKKYEGIDESLSKMNDDFCKAYTKEIDNKLQELKSQLEK